MKRINLVFSFVLLISFANAQSYSTSLGIRIGTDWGVTLNQRILKKVSVEGIVQSSLFRDEVVVTGLIRQHYPVLSRGFNIYTGAGLHKGWLNSEVNNDPFGLTAVVGVELTIGRWNLSYDYKPAVNFTGGDQTIYSQTGISARYVLVKRGIFEVDNKKQRQRQRAKKKRKKEKQKAKSGNEAPGWQFWKKKDDGGKN